MKNFIILFILLSSCSGKIKEGLFCKSNSDCNKTDSVCKTSVCNNNVCIENHKEDLTSCGNDEVCYNGACVVMSGSCNSSEDCLSGNSCKLGVCSGIKTCIYTNKSEGTSCGEGSACYNGYCSGKCVKDENCSQANDCVTGSCLNSGDTYTFSQILSSLFWLNNNWYAQAGSKVYKYDDTFNLITTYDLSSVGSFINGNQIYSDGLKWYITSYSDSKLYVFDLDFNFTGNFGLKTGINVSTSNPEGYLTRLRGIVKVGDTWYIGGELGLNNLIIAIFDNKFNYVKHILNENNRSIVYKDSYLYLKNRVSNSNIYKYDLNLNYTGTEYNFIDYKELNGITSLSKFSYFYKDAWYVMLSNNGSFIQKFDAEFRVKSHCNYENVAGGTACTNPINGYCNAGFCRECYNTTHCNDNKPCTEDVCNFGVCTNPNLTDKTPCSTSSKKYCFSGECLSGCAHDSDCPDPTFCANYYCDNADRVCKSNVKNQGKACDSSLIKTCEQRGDNAYCGLSQILNTLCGNSIPKNTGVAHGYYTDLGAANITNSEKVYALAGKYWVNGVSKCGGIKFPSNDLSDTIGTHWTTMFGNDNTTPEKDGFDGAEYITFLIRTTNYVCRVKGAYHVEFGWVSNSRWYPTSISQILKFRAYSFQDQDVDFSDSNNCCPKDNQTCISNIGKNDLELKKTCYNKGAESNFCNYQIDGGTAYKCVCNDVGGGSLEWRIRQGQVCRKTPAGSYCEDGYNCTNISGSYKCN